MPADVLQVRADGYCMMGADGAFVLGSDGDPCCCTGVPIVVRRACDHYCPDPSGDPGIFIVDPLRVIDAIGTTWAQWIAAHSPLAPCTRIRFDDDPAACFVIDTTGSGCIAPGCTINYASLQTITLQNPQLAPNCRDCDACGQCCDSETIYQGPGLTNGVCNECGSSYEADYAFEGSFTRTQVVGGPFNFCIRTPCPPSCASDQASGTVSESGTWRSLCTYVNDLCTTTQMVNSWRNFSRRIHYRTYFTRPGPINECDVVGYDTFDQAWSDPTNLPSGLQPMWNGYGAACGNMNWVNQVLGACARLFIQYQTAGGVQSPVTPPPLGPGGQYLAFNAFMAMINAGGVIPRSGSRTVITRFGTDAPSRIATFTWNCDFGPWGATATISETDEEYFVPSPYNVNYLRSTQTMAASLTVARRKLEACSPGNIHGCGGNYRRELPRVRVVPAAELAGVALGSLL